MSLYGQHLGFALSPGEPGISERLAGMAAVVIQASKTSSAIDQAAAAIAAAAGRGGTLGQQAELVYRFIREHIVFKGDPFGVGDKVRHPDQLLSEIARWGRTSADCDDVATLGATLIAAMGMEPVFIVVGSPGNLDAATGRIKLTHVFYGARAGRTIVPFDPQEGVPPGKWPPREFVGRIEVYPIFRLRR